MFISYAYLWNDQLYTLGCVNHNYNQSQTYNSYLFSGLSVLYQLSFPDIKKGMVQRVTYWGISLSFGKKQNATKTLLYK